MIIVEATLVIEITPEEIDADIWKQQLHLFSPPGDGWSVVKKKWNLHFDANYNRYYVKVSYERDRNS